MRVVSRLSDGLRDSGVVRSRLTSNVSPVPGLPIISTLCIKKSSYSSQRTRSPGTPFPHLGTVATRHPHILFGVPLASTSQMRGRPHEGRRASVLDQSQRSQGRTGGALELEGGADEGEGERPV